MSGQAKVGKVSNKSNYDYLLKKHELVLEMLKIAEEYLKSAHNHACSFCDSTGSIRSHCNKALEEIERLKNENT